MKALKSPKNGYLTIHLKYEGCSVESGQGGES